jgi:hypothetical protein
MSECLLVAVAEFPAASGTFLAIDQIYARYRTWADDSGVRMQLGKNKFSERLKDLGYQRSKGTKGSRGFRDIQWRNDYIVGDHLGKDELPAEPMLVDFNG